MTFRFSRHFLGGAIVVGVNLAVIATALGQSSPGGDTPTGLAGSWGGSTSWGSGTYDFYERNLSRSVVDMTVPGSVIPFTYTRIWNSRNQNGSPVYSTPANSCPIVGCRDNWSWGMAVDQDLISEGVPANERFHGYFIGYPDGRVVQFGKVNKKDSPDVPGTYIHAAGIFDRFVVYAPGAQPRARLFLSDGTVVNFSSVGGVLASSVVDPHGLTVTMTVNSQGETITEPGGRWIRIGPTQGAGTNDETTTVTSSLGQSVTYRTQYDTPSSDGIKTALGTVTYNNVVDPSTNQPIKASYVYKWVQPPSGGPTVPPAPPFYRMEWMSDPMFDGPLQQAKLIYTPPSLGNKGLRGDPAMNAIQEEHSASATDPNYTGVMVNSCEMGLVPDCDTGCNKDYWTRIQTRGDGTKRTISYYNSSLGRGQNLVDHVTDWTNDLNIYERREYDWTHYFQTPIRITDMNQHLTRQTLEPVLGHITRETHPDPQQSHRDWAYTNGNAPYYVASTTDEGSHTTTFTRDPTTHRVTRVDYPTTSSAAGIYPQTSYETFGYTPLGQIQTHRLTSGGTESFAYYPGNDTVAARRNCLQSWTNADGKTTSYDYDALGRVSTVTDPRGTPSDPKYTTNYEYNGRHQVTKIKLPPDPVTGQRYTVQKDYNAQTGTLASVTDELGHPTSYGYDGYKRVIWVKDATNQVSTTKYGPWKADGTMMGSSALTTNTPTQTISPMGKTVNIYYDANLRKSGMLQAPGSGVAAWTAYYHDDEGNLTSVKDPRGNITSYSYDDRNRKHTQTDPAPFDNQVTTWDYDTTSNLTKETRPDGKFRRLVYDERNHLIDEYGFTNERTHYERDPAGNIGQETMCNGGICKFTYDFLNRKKTCTYPADVGNVVRGEGWLYDATGNMYQYTNPAGQVKTLVYDNRNRVTKSSWSASAGPLTETEYDAASRMTSVKTNNSETLVTLGYDEANRQISEEQTVAGGPTTHIDTPRDNDGNRTGLSIPGGYSLGYDYTQRNQLWHIQGRFTYTYDPAGNMTKRQDVTGGLNDSVNVTYDELSRVTTWENTGANDQWFARSHYAYDTLSRERAVGRDEEGGKGDVFGYNDRNQLISASYDAPTPTPTPTATPSPTPQQPPVITVQPANRTVTVSQTATFSVTATGATSYQWKKNNLNISGASSASYTTPATTASDNGALFYVVVSNAAGSVNSNSAKLTVNAPPGQVQPVSFNPNSFTNRSSPPGSFDATLSTTTAGAVIYWTHNGSDPVPGNSTTFKINASSGPARIQAGYSGRLKAMATKSGLTNSDVTTSGLYNNTDPNQAPPPAPPGEETGSGATQVFTAPPTRNVNYAFTAADPLNRDSVSENGVPTNYTANKMNQYSSVGGQNMSYDGNFNLTGDGNHSYKFDAQNELVGVDGVTVKLVYDGLGRVLKRTINNNVTIFVYDGWKAFEELDGSGNLVAWNIYGVGPDEILWRNQNGTNLIYHTDKEGNVTYLLDGTGKVIERYTYDAFGAAKIYDALNNQLSTSNYQNRYLFNGKDYVAEMGLYDYRHRWYQPQLGRFLQVDPKGFDAGDENLFRYCFDDPVDRVDPDGMDPRSDAERAAAQQRVHEHTEDIRQEVTGSHIPQVVGTQTTFAGPAAAVRAAATALIAQGGNFTVGQVSFTSSGGSNGIPIFPTWQDAGKAGGALAAAQSAKDHQERQGDIGRSDADSHKFTYGPMHMGSSGHLDDKFHKSGFYNQSLVNGPTDLPSGFGKVGIYWSLGYHQQSWPVGDRLALWTAKMHGVLAFPPSRGATLANSAVTYRTYEYIPGSPQPEPYPQ